MDRRLPPLAPLSAITTSRQPRLSEVAEPKIQHPRPESPPTSDNARLEINAGSARRRCPARCGCPGRRSRSSRESPRTGAATSRRPLPRRLGRQRSARPRPGHSRPEAWIASAIVAGDRSNTASRPCHGVSADGECPVAAGDSCGHQTLPFSVVAPLGAGPVAARAARPDGVRDWPRRGGSRTKSRVASPAPRPRRPRRARPQLRGHLRRRQALPAIAAATCSRLSRCSR